MLRCVITSPLRHCVALQSCRHVGGFNRATPQDDIDGLFDIENVLEEAIDSDVEKTTYTDNTFSKNPNETALTHSTVARLFRAMKTAKVREGKQCLLMEGMSHLRDATKMGYRPLACIYEGREGEEQFRSLRLDKVRTLRVNAQEMADLCQTKTPQKVATVMKIPHVLDRFQDPSNFEAMEARSYGAGDFRRWYYRHHGSHVGQLTPHMPLVVVCDTVRDPTNLGTLIRSAAAAGCQLVICINCVKPFHPKVVRCSAGTVLQIPVINATWADTEELISKERRILMAHSSSRVMQVEGVSTLPPDLQQDYRSFLLRIPKNDFRSCDWGKTTCGSVLMVGNEARGFSVHALDFAMKRAAEQVCVPMTEGVNSLNVAMASTVMLFQANHVLKAAPDA